MAAPWLGARDTLLGVHLHNSSRARGRTDAMSADARRALLRSFEKDTQLLAHARDVRLPAQLRAACACRPALCKAQFGWHTPPPTGSANATVRALKRLAGATAARSLSEQESFAACFTQRATAAGTAATRAAER